MTIRCGGKQAPRRYTHLSYIIPGKGLRIVTAKVIKGRGQRSKNIVYPKPGDLCTEPRFRLYQVKDELRLRMPGESPRRLRRFLRDWTRQQGGLLWTVNIWTTPWR